jgi:flagellar biosynthesis/type III secretory pathway protein FliH
VATLKSKHAREIAKLKADDLTRETTNVTKPVARQKAHDPNVLRRALRKQKSRRRREIAAAQASGYATGNAAGYASGHSTGVQDGIDEASDELTCSDDSDVALPACKDW